MRDWSKTERMPKSGVLGIGLVELMPNIANIFLFEVPAPNG